IESLLCQCSLSPALHILMPQRFRPYSNLLSPECGFSCRAVFFATFLAAFEDAADTDIPTHLFVWTKPAADAAVPQPEECGTGIFQAGQTQEKESGLQTEPPD